MRGRCAVCGSSAGLTVCVLGEPVYELLEPGPRSDEQLRVHFAPLARHVRHLRVQGSHVMRQGAGGQAAGFRRVGLRGSGDRVQGAVR